MFVAVEEDDGKAIAELGAQGGVTGPRRRVDVDRLDGEIELDGQRGQSHPQRLAEAAACACQQRHMGPG